ncbi:trehalose-phosphatase-domain-containing protein [Suillus lakei]|nr:trehalose-phosphatase-domain-containing protein [Suillus lakei]
MLLSQTNGQNTARQTPYIPRDRLKELYDNAGKHLFLFDYDGTLTPIVKMPSMALLSPDALTALAKLTSDPNNIVYIVSGRDQTFPEEHVGHFPRLGMSAEHGEFICSLDSAVWMNFTANLDMGWMEEVAEIFRYYTERTTGSHIEMKKSSITWHYRSADPEWGHFQCRQCQDLLEKNVVPKRPIEVLAGKKNLEVRPIAANKGEFVKRILYQNPGVEFIFLVTMSKRTLASWHVTTAEEVVEHMLYLVGETPQGEETNRYCFDLVDAGSPKNSKDPYSSCHSRQGLPEYRCSAFGSAARIDHSLTRSTSLSNGKAGRNPVAQCMKNILQILEQSMKLNTLLRVDVIVQEGIRVASLTLGYRGRHLGVAGREQANAPLAYVDCLPKGTVHLGACHFNLIVGHGGFVDEQMLLLWLGLPPARQHASTTENEKDSDVEASPSSEGEEGLILVVRSSPRMSLIAASFLPNTRLTRSLKS